MISCKFDDFVRLQRGFDLPDSKVISGQYPVVAASNIKTLHNAYKVNPPVVITGRSGTLGNVQYIDSKCWPLNTTLYSKDFRGNFPLYVYYYLKLMHLEQYNAGAGVPTLNQNHLHNIKITIHPKKEQTQVAHVLQSYDTLIENNTRRIALLEKMAQELYKEWFVRFRFPGHEHVKMVNGMPEGWEYLNLNKICEIKYGKENCERPDGNIPIFGSGGIMCFGKKAIYSGESVLIPRKGSLNNIMYYNGDFWTVDTMFYSIMLMKNCAKYLYYSLSQYDMTGLNTGSALPSMTTDILSHIKILLPDTNSLKLFDKIVDVWYRQKKAILAINQNLTKQRDLLLPRLMSGKLELP